MPVTRREFTPAEQELVRMAPVLAYAELKHGSCKDKRVRDLLYCSCYWKIVFHDHYGEAPSGDTDPRWDALFKSCFPIVRLRQSMSGSP